MKTSVALVVSLLLPPLLAAPASAQSVAGAEAPAMAGFGSAVAVGDGVVFVGEGENVMRPGMVYVYRTGPDGAWRETDRLTAPDGERADGFGHALAARPGVLLVGQVRESGEGTVHAFMEDGRRWAAASTLVPEDLPAGLRYGAALAIQGDVAAVGAPGDDDAAGRVYLFRATRNGWRETGMVQPGTVGPGDAFGAALALDGNRLLVGAPRTADGTGAAYVFRLDPGTGEWLEETRLEGEGVERRGGFGTSVALSPDAALVAAPGYENAVGAVLEFRRRTGTEEWHETARLRPFDGARFTRFGAAVAFGPGEAWVGAPGAGEGGAIYVLRRGESGWSGAEKRVAEVVAPGGGFGASLALAGDVAVAGATGEDFGAGAAVILARSDGTWAVAEKVASPPESLAALTGGEVRCQGGEVAGTFACQDVDLLAFLPVSEIGGGRGVRVNDIWGWTDPDSGREYAIVGRVDGTSFVDISDPSNPRYLGDLPRTEGSNAAVWRDIKVYDDHAFIVADGAGQHGMQVFDLTRLRAVRGDPVTFDADALYDRIASAHNIVVDTASGFAFAVGARGGGETCGGGLHMIDIRAPTRPGFAGCFADPQTGRASTGYSHDAQCVTYEGPDADYRGREICLGANETALSIADVTDKDAPVAVARAGYPNVGYTHQGWLTPDQRYFYMNDELDELQGKTARTRTLIWDVSDLDDPQLVGEFMGTTEASDHNLYIRDQLMYQSNYQAGLRIIDISDPESPREVGFFDTVPYGENTPGFGGSWSNYPYFPSGTIAVTSGREGLFLVRKREPVS